MAARPLDDGVADYLKKRDQQLLLRFITCGSVDAGKSTLIGRLLYQTGQITEDQLAILAVDSAKCGTTGRDVDLALLVDGLEAEREQGITIDVAYRSFETDDRRFIIADTPGHEEYTRNTATAASTADFAVILVDARHGILAQTRRHSVIASLLGIRHVVLAVNKIDLACFEEATFGRITADYLAFAKRLDFDTIQSIPLSALSGDNVVERSARMPWYTGPSFVEHLGSLSVRARDVASQPFRFPVQRVSRAGPDFRGFSGQVASGRICVGDTVTVARSRIQSRVNKITTMEGNQLSAEEGEAVTLVLDEEIDVSRGDVFAGTANEPETADQFQAHIIWFDNNPLMPGRSYFLQTECDVTTTNVTKIKYVVDIETLGAKAAGSIGMNEIGVCNFYLQKPITFDPYKQNRSMGNFILIHRETNATVGAGVIDFALHRAKNLHPQPLEINKQERAALMNQRPAVVWLTGLSASGKSTIANSLEKLLHAAGYHTAMLDGDNVRHGLNRDLGFTDVDRVENIRRVAEVAKLMTDAGLIVIVSFISPFRSERQMARDLLPAGEFIEVFVDTPIEECIRRDPKGLYRRAIAGMIENFTGISSSYEQPEAPELQLNTMEASAEELALSILAFLKGRPHSE